MAKLNTPFVDFLINLHVYSVKLTKLLFAQWPTKTLQTWLLRLPQSCQIGRYYVLYLLHTQTHGHQGQGLLVTNTIWKTQCGITKKVLNLTVLWGHITLHNYPFIIVLDLRLMVSDFFVCCTDHFFLLSLGFICIALI